MTKKSKEPLSLRQNEGRENDDRDLDSRDYTEAEIDAFDPMEELDSVLPPLPKDHPTHDFVYVRTMDKVPGDGITLQRFLRWKYEFATAADLGSIYLTPITEGLAKGGFGTGDMVAMKVDKRIRKKILDGYDRQTKIQTNITKRKARTGVHDDRMKLLVDEEEKVVLGKDGVTMGDIQNRQP